jgi:hypothetical protein
VDLAHGSDQTSIWVFEWYDRNDPKNWSPEKRARMLMRETQRRRRALVAEWGRSGGAFFRYFKAAAREFVPRLRRVEDR